MLTKIPIQKISIEGEGFHLMIKANINGKKANILIDTGASRTVFDSEQIKNFIPEDHDEFEDNEKLSTGLGTDSLASQATTIDELQFGDLIIKNYIAVVLDMKHINQSYSKLNFPAIDGVLGGDLLSKYKAVIYYKEKILKLYYYD